MIIYLDNCCYNRPFDDQSSISIKIESEAKLYIQDEIRNSRLELVWSYALDYENSKNPHKDRFNSILVWKFLSNYDVIETPDIIRRAKEYMDKGLKMYDSLHIACAVGSKCDYFITTDKFIINKSDLIKDVAIINPVNFVTIHERENENRHRN